MALLSFVCTVCGHRQEELVKSAEDAPVCEKCGGRLRQSFSGKCYGNIGGAGGGECTHNCATCKGCGSGTRR